MIVCPKCGHENESGAKFCSQCATSLEEAKPDGGTERKVITVLFADLVGFTWKAERLDPEDVQAVLKPYHERLRYELERWGGTVEKFIGDAGIALFGAPVARENDPERAVRAALAIRDWIAEEGELQVRIAVNTGEALVSLGVRPEAGEGMAAGDVVNTAARLQSFSRETINSRWLDVRRAVLAGDLHGAAELLAEIDAPTLEAFYLLQSGTEQNVRAALDFYRGMRATRYVREGEALLAMSA